jgi:hypothetical protein
MIERELEEGRKGPLRTSRTKGRRLGEFQLECNHHTQLYSWTHLLPAGNLAESQENNSNHL